MFCLFICVLVCAQTLPVRRSSKHYIDNKQPVFYLAVSIMVLRLLCIICLHHGIAYDTALERGLIPV
jgi:hypothetical protein